MPPIFQSDSNIHLTLIIAAHTFMDEINLSDLSEINLSQPDLSLMKPLSLKTRPQTQMVFKEWKCYVF